MCPSRDKIQLCTGPQQRGCNQQVEGSASGPVFSTGEPKSGSCIQLWASQAKAPWGRGGSQWGQSTWHETAASMRLWANREEQTCSLKDAQLKISCSMGNSDQLQGKDNFTLRMVKHSEKNPEILYPCTISANLYQLHREGPLRPSSTQISLTCQGMSGLLQELCLFFSNGTSVTEWIPWSVFKESHSNFGLWASPTCF